MKKTLLALIACLAFAIPVSAQQKAETPNRMLIHNAAGYSGHVIDRVDSLTFAHVAGDVKAEIEILEATCDSLKLSVTRTESCKGFKINVVPATIAGQITNDQQIIAYLNSIKSPTYYEDFTEGILSGIQLNADSKYVVYTVGIDLYGIEDGVCKAEFSTPASEIIGNPEVTVEILERTLKTFKIAVSPNEHVDKYYCVAGEKGTMQQQYEQFGPMFGFTNFSQMIKMWGTERSGIDEVEWTDMAPNTLHEIFIVCSDENGNLAPYQVFEVSTLELGGPGKASVAITLGEYKLTDWGSGEEPEMKPSQFIKFTPNDQTSCYRMGVYKASIYDTVDKETLWSELRSDPPMPTAYWFFYEEMETDFQIDPAVEAVAIAAAKNINGEWGDVTELRFTTPAEAGEADKAGYVSSATIIPRLKALERKNKIGGGTVPHFRKVGLTLQH